MRHHSSDTPLIGRPPVGPSLPRASTVPTGKPAAFAYHDTRSRSGSRRAASHRDVSPRSGHYYRSTPDSRRSMRSSMSESDNDTELTPDDEDERVESIVVDETTLRDRLDIRRRPSQEFQWQRIEKQRDQEQEPDILHLREQQQHQQKQTPNHRHHRHRRSSGSRGGGGGSSSRGPRQSVIYEEEPEDDDLDIHAEMDRDDVDDERRRRRTPSRHGRRSVSRHTTATQDRRRVASRSKSRLRRADSLDDEWNPRQSSKRDSRRYAESELPTATYADGPSTLRRAQTHPTAPSHVTAPPSVDSTRRPSSLFETPLGLTSQVFSTDKSPRRISCLVCMEEFPLSRVTKLDCGHRMCSTCLKRKFKLSMGDMRQMPPRCCTSSPIAPKYVEKLFDPNFKKAWNSRFREFSIGDRIYCPQKRCGEWIKSEHMFQEEGREIARCSRCRTKVCCRCNGKWHAAPQCPDDEETAQFLEQVRLADRQRCHKCKNPVELIEGRNHMVCRCGTESCMICGAKWRHCDCPIFDCDEPDDDLPSRFQYGSGGRRSDRFGSAPAATPKDFRAGKGGRPHSSGESMRARPQSYEEKLRLRQRMDDFRTDELTRRMQSFRGLEEDDAMDFYDEPFHRDSQDRDEDMDNRTRVYADDDLGLRPRRRRSFVDNEYHDRAATDILPSVPQPPPAPPTPPQQQAQPTHRHQQPRQHQHQHLQQEQHQPPPPPHSQFPEPSYDRTNAGGDYYTNGVSRARGVHPDSQVGRLADRFNTDYRASPMHRAPGPSAPPVPTMPAPLSLGVGGGGAMPMAPLSPMGPMPLMPPMVSMSAPPPPPTMAGIPLMPMAPGPAPGMLPDVPLMRRHTMENDPFGNADLRGTRSPDRIMFPDRSRSMMYDEPDADFYASGGSGRRHRRRDEAAHLPQHAHQSVMAGLTGPGRGMDRVPEWLNYVEPLDADGDSSMES